MGFLNNKNNAYSQQGESVSSQQEELMRIDLADDENYYYIYAEVPGRKSEDIKLKFKGSNLSIRVVAENDDNNPINNKDCTIQERMHEEYERLIRFTEPVDKKKVDAMLANGLLSITVKKMNPEEEDEEGLIAIRG